jgi:hypothetical protein
MLVKSNGKAKQIFGADCHFEAEKGILALILKILSDAFQETRIPTINCLMLAIALDFHTSEGVQIERRHEPFHK